MDDKNTQSPQDFEMGSAEQSSSAERSGAPSGVQINKYTKDIKSPESNENPAQQIDPSDGVPPKSAPKPTAQKTKPKKKELSLEQQIARKKAMLGCLGAFGITMVILLILSFIFLAGSDENTVNPIAQLLGINQATFINGLITFVHILFILVALTAFTFTMVGLFKASMAKKEDKVAKKSGLRTSLISGVLLVVILIVWMFVFIYLDSKRIQTEGDLQDPIVTEPEETLNLTAPIEIRFDATYVPVNTSQYQIISYNWDFGDGSTGTNLITTHTYKDKGEDGRYDIILTVTRRDKDTGEEFQDVYTKIVTIANEALRAVFSADPQSGEAPLEVKFDASDSSDPDGTIETYEWDFDEDGKFDDAEGAEAEYEFEKIGRYTVSLRVTSSTGEYDVEEKEIIVEENVLPEVDIYIEEQPEYFFGGYLTAGKQYVFKGGGSTSPNGDIESYEWDFGDGSQIETTKTVAHTFEFAGNYEIELVVVDEEGEEGVGTLEVEVVAEEGVPVAAIKTTPAIQEGDLSLSGTVPFQVTFDASDSTDSDNAIVDYEWDFDNDGKSDAYSETASYTYKTTGTYTAKLTITDASGNENTTSISVVVEEQGIIAALESSKVDGNVPLTVEFDASGSTYDGGSITSYKWEFGDGTSPKLGSSSITHKYTSIGSFTAKVTVIGSDNSQDTDEVIITVREIPLTACFTSVFEEGPAPLTTTFDPSCSTGTVANYFWRFGDGGTSSAVKPTHTFDEAGEYTVELEISDAESNLDTTEMTITVTE